jgi:Fe-S oxidoreductase
MSRVYAPGCALLLYKPELAEKALAALAAESGESVAEHLTCCHHDPRLAPGSVVINTCAGCDRRYRELYEGVSTISLWEVLAESDSFPFPDYGGAEMTVHDACPTRTEERVHRAVRTLLERMNITVVEPKRTGTHAVCCGDSSFGIVPDERVKAQMRNRAAEMPCDDVVVYCVSCVKSMHIGGKRPRYLVDLLFAEETTIGTFEPSEWHAQIDAFIATH